MSWRAPWLLANAIAFTYFTGQKPRSTKVPYSVLLLPKSFLKNCICRNCVSEEFCSGDNIPWGCRRKTLDRLLLGILKWCLWGVISSSQLGLPEHNLYSIIYFTLSILQQTFSETWAAEYLNLLFFQVSELYYEEAWGAVPKDSFCCCRSHWTATLKWII